MADWSTTYSNKFGVIVPIFGFSSVPESGVLPVQVQAVKAVLPQESHCRLDELPSAGGIGHHGTESLGAFVPAADRQERLQVLVVGLQTGKLAIAAYSEKGKKKN